MNLHRSSSLNLLKIGSAILVITIIIIYAIFRSFNYARGPKIDIIEPVNGSAISTSTTAIIGKVERSNLVLLNNQPISIDEKGNFKENIIIFHGINTLTITAKDQFDRQVTKQIQILGQNELPSYIRK